MSLAQINLVNPLPPLFQDKNDKGAKFKDGKLIPFRGESKETAHGFLKLLYDLYELSPSQFTCVNNVISYGFSGNIDLERNVKAGLMLNADTTLGDEAKLDWCDRIERYGISPLDIVKLSQFASIHKKVSGNAFVLYRLVNQNGEYNLTLQVIDSRCPIYLKDDSVKYDKVRVFNNPSEIDDSNKDNFRDIPVYPAFNESRNIKECVFHLKNCDISGSKYSMPDSLGSLRWQYVEYMLNDLSCKVSGEEYVAKHLAVVRGLEPLMKEDGDDEGIDFIKEMGRSIRKIVAQNGNDGKQRVMALLGLPAEAEFDLHSLDVNRDTNWYAKQENSAAFKIFSAHRDNRQLAGDQESKSNLGGDFMSPLYVKYGVTIQKYQDEMSNFFKLIFGQLSEDVNDPIIGIVKIKFEDKISQIVDRLSTEPKAKVVNE